MCLMKTPTAAAPAAIVADTSNLEATRTADAQRRIRAKRAGAAANILTGPRGIPRATSQLGAVQ